MLTNVVVQRLTGDVSTPKTRQLAFTALSLTTATSNLASPVAAGYLIEHFSYAAVYMWALGLPLRFPIVLLFPGMRRLLNTASRRRKKFLEADGQTNKERSGSAMDFLKESADACRSLCFGDDLHCLGSRQFADTGLC